MKNKEISLSPNFHFFFTFPFNLGFSIEYSPLNDYLSSLDKVATSLNSNFPNYLWSRELFDKSLPLSLQAKGGFLLGQPKSKINIHKVIEDTFAREQIGARLEDKVEESVVYFYHGVGSVNLTIHASIEATEVIPRLQQLAMAIIGDIRNKEDSLYIIKEWESFRKAMRKSFEYENVLYDMWGILSMGGEGRGPTRYVGENAILRTVQEGPLKIEIEDIPTLLAPFTGLKSEENINVVPFVDGIIYLAEGWDGQIAIVSDPERERWLENLWQFATDYGTLLHDLDRYLYTRTLNLQKESKSINLKQSAREMDAINRIELSIDVITHELLPYNFGGIAEEIQVYRGIYDSWEMGTIVESLKNKFTFLNTMFANMNARRSNLLQVRMNSTMLLFTVLTLAGVLAGVISTTDFNGEFLGPRLRLFVIIFGTISAGLLAIVSLIIGRNKISSRRKNGRRY